MTTCIIHQRVNVNEATDKTDLLHAVDELVPTLLGEVLLGKEVVSTVTLLVSLVLALIGHTISEVVL
jgi:hypothetical protein